MAKYTQLRDRLRELQKGLCCYCDVPMVIYKDQKWHDDEETLEHLKQKSDGGLNTPDNFALACRECNSGRGMMDWFTFKSYRQGELFCTPL